MADFDADQWQLVLADPATNYLLLDHTTAVIGNNQPERKVPVLIVDAKHIETGVELRLTIRIPIRTVRPLAQQFTLMADDLEQPGATTQ